MRLRNGRLTAMALLLTIMFLAGCGDSGPPRYHVSGSVTYEGKPVPHGSILFQPLPSTGGGAATGNATIRDGKYDTRVAGEPISGGPQIVIIEAFDGKVVNPDYAPFGESLGDSYRRQHDLPEEDATLDVELTER